MATVSLFAAHRDGGVAYSDARMTPPRWAPQEPTEVATVSQSAAPRGGTARIPSDAHMATLRLTSQEPAKCHDSAVRSPQGQARSHSDARMTTLRWSSREPAEVSTARSPQPPGDGEISF